jgi:2-polyprenyl-3-methyl-5-hydroxy-6-metoxy-1,4-benzoquinol methylase
MCERENDMTNPTWYPDELASAGQEHLDPGYVATYDRKAATDWTSELDLLRAYGLDATKTLVDLGAGTGLFAEAAAPFCKRVVAVDVSPAMVAIIRAHAGQSGLTNLESVQQGLLSYEHQGEPADFVYSRHVLHHLPDFWKVVALQRMAGMLKPGGVLRLRDLMYSFEPGEINQTIESWLSRAAASPDAGWTRVELETHVREEYSTFTWLLEAMIERCGFRIDRVDDTSSKIYAAYVCVKR